MGLKGNYKKKLAAGNFGEQVFRRLLDNAGIPNNKNPEKSDKSVMIEWDVEGFIDGRRFTVEIKFDQMQARTGNLAIEFFNTKQGKPSGLSATTADLWCVVLQDPVTVWIAKTEELKYYVATHSPDRVIASGGDDNASLYLYRSEEILSSVFYQIDIAPHVMLSTVIKELLGGS